MMLLKRLSLTAESYTHPNWVYKNENVDFSRLYFILDGEAYYEENGKAVRFKKHHLYLTPVNQNFSLYENPDDKLLHTYSHIVTIPKVTRFIEIKVEEGTPLADTVALWRKYVHSEDREWIANIVSLLLSQIGERCSEKHTVAEKIREYLDSPQLRSLNMAELSRRLGYSREHLTRVFRSVYRDTSKQYFNARRMKLALERLSDGEKVKAVAHQLGFASPYSFSLAFKKHFGASPKQYLALVRNTESVSAKP